MKGLKIKVIRTYMYIKDMKVERKVRMVSYEFVI